MPPDLPHGWRMKNSSVDIAGPPIEEDGFANYSDEDETDLAEPLDIQPDSDGWEDVEDDTEVISVKCLLCDDKFPAVKTTLAHCSQVHDFDLRKIRQDHGLDFYATIKLVNYIRSAVAAGNPKPVVDNVALWSDDKFLVPTLEDDPFLFELDEIDDIPFPADEKEGEATSVS